MQNTIVLEAHICDQRRSYKVTFPGTPAGEAMAIAFMEARSSTHVVSEWLIWEERWVNAAHGGDDFYRQDELAADQPHRVYGHQYPALYAKLYPTCHHGMSASLCMDPYGENHFGTLEWERSMGY